MVQIGANSQFGGRYRWFDELLVPAARSEHRAGNGREEARGHEREQGKEGRRLHDALDYHEAARSVRQTVSDRTLPSDLI